MIYKPYDIVVVPFPFADSGQVKRRPALVISSHKNFGKKSKHTVLAMITSLRNAPWPLDLPIRDLEQAGLPKPSVIRMKFFTLDNTIIIENIGSLAPEDQKAIKSAIKKLFEELL